MRTCKAVVTVATGHRGTQQFPVERVEQYMTDQSMDNDADQFSIDIGNSDGMFDLLLERDNEAQVNLFLSDVNGKFSPIFSGIGDVVQGSAGHVLSVNGRDIPSAVALDSDALPGRVRNVKPDSFIRGRAHSLGISRVRIPAMAIMPQVVTDGSEKEWALWYRIARERGMYAWSDNLGGLVIDHLGYSLKPTHFFGHKPSGDNRVWMGVEDFQPTSTKQTRLYKSIVYGLKGAPKKSKQKKTARALIATTIDHRIEAWTKHSTQVLTDTVAKKQVGLQSTSDLEIFESIVGAQEVIVIVPDNGQLIAQNTMCVLNLPEYGVEMESWFIVGVQRIGGPNGLTQVVRLREKNFALSKRVPKAPKITYDPATNRPPASIAQALASNSQIRWPDSFVKATQVYGSKNGWDFAVFLGVLLSICDHETHFKNIRESWESNAFNPWTEWSPVPKDDSGPQRYQVALEDWHKTFANSTKNPFNPFYPTREAGVGPMQLTDANIKEYADNLGWQGKPTSGEYDGGRWNPDSNIMSSAHLLIEKLKSKNANSGDANSIWLGVEAYAGSGSQAHTDMLQIKALFDNTWYAAAQGAVAAAQSIPPGTVKYTFNIPGHGELTLPSGTPKEAAAAITWAIRHMGDPYQWNGSGPYYDCSSFVSAALAKAADYLNKMIDQPVARTNHHGDNTVTLFAKGTKVAKDSLLPADLVFFRGTPPEHVAMYLGDGLCIHDPHTGATVTVDTLPDLSSMGYVGARRFVNWPVPPAFDHNH